MKKIFLLPIILIFVVACAPVQIKSSRHPSPGATLNIRTTAYTHTEAGGRNNAVGTRLTSGKITSAAADWSRFPIGTKFEMVNTGEVFLIQDYGSALVGTDTIDLYKTTRRTMRNWGVRYVKVKILDWGSATRSLEILKPRVHNRHVQEMVLALKKDIEKEPLSSRKFKLRTEPY